MRNRAVAVRCHVKIEIVVVNRFQSRRRIVTDTGDIRHSFGIDGHRLRVEQILMKLRNTLQSEVKQNVGEFIPKRFLVNIRLLGFPRTQLVKSRKRINDLIPIVFTLKRQHGGDVFDQGISAHQRLNRGKRTGVRRAEHHEPTFDGVP